MTEIKVEERDSVASLEFIDVPLQIGNDVSLKSLVRSRDPDTPNIWFGQDANGGIWKIDVSVSHTVCFLFFSIKACICAIDFFFRGKVPRVFSPITPAKSSRWPSAPSLISQRQSESTHPFVFTTTSAEASSPRRSFSPREAVSYGLRNKWDFPGEKIELFSNIPCFLA